MAAATTARAPTVTAPDTITRRSPSRSAASPAAYDPRIFPNANDETASPATAADTPSSALMKPFSAGSPWSTIETPSCARVASVRRRHGFVASARIHDRA